MERLLKVDEVTDATLAVSSALQPKAKSAVEVLKEVTRELRFFGDTYFNKKKSLLAVKTCSAPH